MNADQKKEELRKQLIKVILILDLIRVHLRKSAANSSWLISLPLLAGSRGSQRGQTAAGCAGQGLLELSAGLIFPTATE